MTPSIFIQYFSAPCSKICKQRWGLTIRNEMRSSLFTDDTIIYTENIKVSTEKFLGWMSSQIQDKYLKIFIVAFFNVQKKKKIWHEPRIGTVVLTVYIYT